jgi:hypothetical protein
VYGSDELFKIHQRSKHLAAERIFVIVVEFLKSQQVEFLSNLCWKPYRGVEMYEEL